MRAVAFSVWIFINLAFLGMGGYIYLIISTYWCRKMHTIVEPFPQKKIKFDRKNQVIFYEPNTILQESKSTGGSEILVNSTKYNFFFKHLYRLRRRSSNDKPCSNGDLNCSDFGKNESKLEEFKNKLFIQFRRVLHEESNVFKTDNPYFVNYKGPRGRYQRLSSDEIKCRLKNVGLRLLTNKDYPFSENKLRKIIGNDLFLNGKHFNTCAIVSSAGSLLHSGLGPMIELKPCVHRTDVDVTHGVLGQTKLRPYSHRITGSRPSLWLASLKSSMKIMWMTLFDLRPDAHDIVLRFNHAPTKEFETDVGSKTTIRLVNSQVVSKKEFDFIKNPLYRNITLVVWDPSNYSSTLKQWYEKPDFNFFENWSEQKLLNSKKNSFIADPRTVWKTWNFIQSLTSMRIRKNPPSSGFLGLVLLMPYCDVIDFFEFVPSRRITKKCHYFDDIQDESCTFGVWHPLSAEKMLSVAMNEANDSVVFETGFIRIRGFRNLKC